MKLIQPLFIIGLFATLAACSSTPSSSAGGGDFDSQLAATEAAYSALEKNGGAWRDTKEMLDDAKKAMAANDAATANKKLSAAKSEVEMASAQHEQQKNAAPYLF